MPIYQSVTHIKILFCLLTGVGLGIIAWLDLLQGATEIGLATGCLSFTMLLNGVYLLIRRGKSTSNYLEWLFIVLLCSFSLLASQGLPQGGLYWVYFFPLAAFFLFSLRAGIILIVVYTPLAVLLISNFAPDMAVPQMVFSLLAITLVALTMALAQARTDQHLEPLIDTDSTTGALLEKGLLPSLNKEIARAEREGTGLLLMSLAWQPLGNTREDMQSLLVSLAQEVRLHLRAFDSFFRIGDDQILVLMPHADSHEAKALANRLQTRLHRKLTVTAGLASLNVGDTASVMLDKSGRALSHAIAHQEPVGIFREENDV
ncbi:MAG: diguanylate cyclase [Oceanospirillaceae bacterium]|nr:diguanylate cyclase [Oceanospirillaceae bacterium]MCP5334505.1 diguanylate cyclase [Oceanospirillaceae bacterium]MCP5350790.1 diguanylate cyclase [Oceanospirillaceae bacterium]